MGWVLQVLWDRWGCREKEGESDQRVQWENVEHLDTSANPDLWVLWEFPVCQVFLGVRE